MLRAIARFLKRLAFVLIALVGIALGLSALALVVLDDDDYRTATVALVERATKSELTIAGDFQLSLSARPSLTASNVGLAARSGSYRVTARHVAIKLQPARLWSGLIWCENLELEDVAVTLNSIPEKRVFGLMKPANLMPVFESARINNLVVEDKRRGEQRAANYAVTSLAIGQPGHGEKLQISGNGDWAGKTFELTGELGSIEDLLQRAAPYPINLRLHAPESNLVANGTVRDPLALDGIDLAIEIHSREPSKLLAYWWEAVPKVGETKASATLVGSAKSLRLANLSLQIDRPDVMSLRLNGDLGIGRFPKDTHLTFAAQLLEPGELQHLLPADWPAFSKAQADGVLRDENGQLQLQDVKLTALTEEGLDMTLAGTAALNLTAAEPPFRNLSATLDFNAPMTTALRPLLPENLPNLGPVSGHLRLASDGDALSVEDIEVNAGAADSAQAHISGRLGRLPMIEDDAPADFDLDIAIDSKDTATLSRPLGWDLPEMGAVKASARLVGNGNTPSVEQIDIRAGRRAAVQLRIKGRTGIGPPGQRTRLRHSKFDVDLSASSTARLGSLVNRTLPDIGPFKGRMQVSGEAEKLTASIVNLQAGSDEGPFLKGKGVIERIHLPPSLGISGVRLTLSATAPTTRSLDTVVGRSLPEFGPLTGSALLVQGKKVYTLRDVALSAGKNGSPLWSADGAVRDLFRMQGIKLNVYTDTQTNALFGAWTDETHPDLGRVKGKLAIAGSADALSVPSIDLKFGLDGVYQGTLRGTVNEVGSSSRFDLTHTLDIDDPGRFARLFEVDVPVRKPVKTAGRLVGQQGAERLTTTIRTGNSEARVELTGAATKTRTAIKGKITIPVLHLADLPLAENSASDTAKTKTAKTVFGRTPFKLDGLRQMNTDLAIRIDEVVGSRANIDTVTGRLTIQEGRLKLSPLRLSYAGGNAKLDLELDARARPQVRLNLLADDIPLSTVLETAGTSAGVHGDLSLDVDLKSRGHSAHELASNLHGHFRMMAENGRVPRRYFDLADSDLLGWVVSKTAPSQREVRLDCGILSLAVNQGVATSEALLIDGPDTAVTGTLSLDLGKESIDLKIYPKRKTRLGPRLEPISVTGPLSDPTVTTLSKLDTAKTFGKLILVPQLYAGEKALGYLSGLLTADSTGADNPCRNLKQQLHESVE